MKSDKKKEASHTQLVTQVIQALVDFVMAEQIGDVPKWVAFDLTFSQLRSLVLLGHHGALTVGDLAKLLGLGKPAASVLVQQLVEQRLVERSEDVKDRRRTLVRLATRGTELMSGRQEQREAKLRRWLSQMDSEQLTGLLRGLDVLLEILKSDQSQANETPTTVPSGE
jgi:DNA-binding MarR family transcriptional regulator